MMRRGDIWVEVINNGITTAEAGASSGLTNFRKEWLTIFCPSQLNFKESECLFPTARHERKLK